MKRWIWTVSLSALLGFVAADLASAQTGAASDGPWSGWAQCEVTAQFTGPGQAYLNRQTHTWMLTGTTPTSGTDIKVYPATWTVSGGGSSQRDQGAGRTTTDSWVTAGRAMPDTITFRVDANGVLHIASPAGLRSTDAINGTRVAQSTNGNAPAQTTAIAMYVDEWQPFPDIQDVATKTVIAEAATPRAINVSIAPGPAPPGTATTVACSWNFVRGGAATPPPAARSLSQQLGLKPPAPIEVAAVTGASQPTTTTAAPAGMMTATASPTTSGTTTSGTPTSSKDTTLRQEVLSSGTNNVLNRLQGPAPMNVRAGAGIFTPYFGDFVPFCIQKITVSWDPVSGATGYNVYIDGGSWGRAAAGATSLQIDYTVPYIGLQTSGSSVTSRAQVGALFDSSLEGVSAPVSFTHIDKC